MQQVTQHFWARLGSEYLTSLREFRCYKRRDGHHDKVEDVVLMYNDLLRNTWPLGVVDELLACGGGAAIYET